MTSRDWKWWAALIARIVLGVVFLYAAYTKLRQPWEIFALSIDSYGMLPPDAVLFVARTLPWFELVVGLLLIAGVLLRYAAWTAFALLGVFFGIMVYQYSKGATIDCGCFGVGEALSAKTLVRDGTLLALSLAVALFSRRTRAAAGAPSSEVQP